MKVTIIGAGSAGLAAAIMARTALKAEVRVLERAAEGDAPGLGVALLPFAFNELKMIGLEGFSPYANSFAYIDRATLVFAGFAGGELLQHKRVQDTQYWGVKRATLLSFLQHAAKRAGVRVDYDCAVSEERVRSERASCDLLIGADGAGSIVRATYADEFGPSWHEAKSPYAWLALDGNIEQFIFGYIYVAGKGLIRITAYPHGERESSAIVTYSLGLKRMFEDAFMLDGEGYISAQGLQTINEIFAPGLKGRKLFGRSKWRRFRATQCRHASFGNVALVGDSYATLHYETGWGTSAALQESRILGQILGPALDQGKSIEQALKIFDRKSLEVSRGLVTATARTLREIDTQAAKFYQLGAAKFLAQSAP